LAELIREEELRRAYTKIEITNDWTIAS